VVRDTNTTTERTCDGLCQWRAHGGGSKRVACEFENKNLLGLASREISPERKMLGWKPDERECVCSWM
jgi:hypothetical protein